MFRVAPLRYSLFHCSKFRLARRCHLTEQIGARRRDLFADDSWVPVDDNVAWSYKRQASLVSPQHNERHRGNEDLDRLVQSVRTPSNRAEERVDINRRDERSSNSGRKQRDDQPHEPSGAELRVQETQEVHSAPHIASANPSRIPHISHDYSADSDIARIMELQLVLLDSLEKTAKLHDVQALLTSLPRDEPKSEFQSTSFLEDFVCFAKRVGLDEILQKLTSTSGLHDVKHGLQILSFHLWSLTCPPVEDIADLRQKLCELDTKPFPLTTQVAVAKLVIFLSHPIVDTLLRRSATATSGAALEVMPTKRLTKTQLKRLVVPSSLRSFVSEEIQSEVLSPSTAYRISIIADYAPDETSRSALQDLAKSKPSFELLNKVNAEFRTSLFPPS